jgi:hypothetical protein
MYTEAQKKATLKWRMNNKEKWNNYHNEKGKEYYAQNSDEHKKKRMERYYYSKENSYSEVSKLFRKILI